MELVAVFAATALTIVKVADTAHWSYSDLDSWPPKCLDGMKQSPIAIEKKNIVRKILPPIEFHNYDNKYYTFLQNTGHSVQITVNNLGDNNPNNLPFIKGGFLESEYTLDNVHFHWDSEHTINGYRFPLEAHFVHFKRKDGNLTNALNDPTGVVVLAVMFEVEKCFTSVFNTITKDIDEISKNTNRILKIKRPIRFRDLLPDTTKNFYTYKGSLTTPNCNEDVTWIVFAEPLSIERTKLKKLSNIYTEDKRRLVKNFRPIQKLNGREVIYSGEILGDLEAYARNKFWIG